MLFEVTSKTEDGALNIFTEVDDIKYAPKDSKEFNQFVEAMREDMEDEDKEAMESELANEVEGVFLIQSDWSHRHVFIGKDTYYKLWHGDTILMSR